MDIVMQDKQEEFIVVERSQHGEEMRKSAGEAGFGIYAHLPSKAMRAYYTSSGETTRTIKLDRSAVVDLTESQNNAELIAFAKKEFAKTANEIPGYSAPKVNAGNIQRFGRVIEQFVKQERPWAKAWIVNHEGPGIPKGKQVVIEDESAIQDDSLDKDKKNAGWYYSQLAEAIESAPAKVDNSSGNGWSQWLLANASKLGVKTSEVQWSGITDWLELQGNQKIGKSDILDYLNRNGVKVEEITLGDPMNFAVLDEAFREHAGRFFYDVNPHDRSEILFTDEEGYTVDFDELPKSLQSAAEQFSHATGGSVGETKYDAQQLPGGERYRELLLTLPSKQVTNIAKVVDRDGNFDVEDDDGILKSFPKWAEAQDYAYGTTQDRQIELNRKSAGSYIAPHFDNHQNILAHVRFNERTDADGKRILFLEEIQSDWGQQGKKAGFKGAFPNEVLDAAIKGGMTAEQARADIQHLLDEPISTDARDTGDQWLRLNHAIEYGNGIDLNEVFHDRRDTGVPFAPFVDDTKAWVGLSLKRMISYAVENEFDRIAWTTGAQQAARYNLSKGVEQIHWREYRGEKQIRIDLLSGDGLTLIAGKDGIVTRTEGVGNDPYAGKKIDEIIGKSIAQTIIEKPSGSLSGDNLKVGGDGMIAFYDQIIPQVANDILKKLGGGKVDVVPVGTGIPDKTVDSLGFDTSEIQFKREANGMWTAEKNPDFVIGGTRQYWDGQGFVADEGQARLFGSKAEATSSVTATGQPGFTITSGMRDIVQRKGMPLFRRIDESTAGFYDPEKRILALLKTADPTVFLHESGHLFLDTYTKVAALPDAPPEVVADMNTVREWWKQNAGHMLEILDDDIQRAKDPLRKAEMIEMRAAIDAEGGQGLIEHVANRWQEQETTKGGIAAWTLMHEYFARGAEAYFREGKSPAPEMRSIFTQFRTWLVKSYESILALKVELSPELCGVMDRMLSGAAKKERPEVDGVYSSILREVKATGLFDADVNRAYAAMQGEFFAVLGDKLGIEPNEAYAKYGAKIIGNPALLPGATMPLQTKKRAETEFSEDIPNETWLQEQIDYAKSRPRNEYGVPYMGKTTGSFRGNPVVSVNALSQLKGERGEQDAVRNEDIDWLKSELQRNGLKNVGAPYVEIGFDGVPWVSEGNHRIMAAKQLGWEDMPVEVRYFDGGQRNAGEWAPDALDIHRDSRVNRTEGAMPLQTKKDSNMLDLFGDEVIPGITQGARKRADTVIRHWEEMATQGVRTVGGALFGDRLNPLANRVHDALWEQGDGSVVFHLVEEKIKSNPEIAKLATHPDVKRYVSHRLLESAVACLASHASRSDTLADASASITPQEGKVYVGPIIWNNGRTVLQDTGRNTSVEHQLEKLKMPLPTGKVVRIEYANGQAKVSEASLGRQGNER